MMNCPDSTELCGLSVHELARRIFDSARSHGLETMTDPEGTVFVRKPATKEGPVILFHGHTAAAAWFMLSLIGNTDDPMPELEIVFSIYDEHHRTSLLQYEMSGLRSRLLINLDAASEQEMISSCVGFAQLSFSTEISRHRIPNDCIPVNVRIFGLQGGHAHEIHDGRANAIKLMGDFLFDWYNYSIETYLVDIQGGVRNPSIPTECTARLWIRRDRRTNLEQGCWWFGEDLAKKYGQTDPFARIEVSFPEIGVDDPAWYGMSSDDTGRILSFLNLSPTGVINMSPEQNGLIETSCNIRGIETSDKDWHLTVTVRSFEDDQKDALCQKFELLAQMNRIFFKSIGEFPSWKHVNVSDLQRQYADAYESLYNCSIRIVAIHEEQECMIFASRIPDLQTISVGASTDWQGRPDPQSLERVLETLLVLLKG